MRLNSRMKGFLLNLIKPSSSQKEIQKAERAITIVNRGIAFDSDIDWMQKLGYKG